MKGFNSQIGSVGDAFDRFAQNVSRAFGNVRDLFDGLKQAVLGFFNDLLGHSLQNLVRQTLGGLFGNSGGAGGGLGNLFRTPSFAGGGGGNPFQAIAQAFAGGAGGEISAPPSISAAALGRIAGAGFAAAIPGDVGSAAGGAAGGAFGRAVSGAAGSAAGGFSFSALGKSLGNLAPFLGLQLGSGIGGTSTAGNILGGIGGALGGLVLGASTGAIGGSLGSLFALSGALGPAALVAAPLLLIGGALLGKAKQRHRDEEASGEMIRQALASIDQLAAGISSDQIEGAQARAVFDTQILGTFRQQIGGLQTASVRESRLKNTTRDLENVYQARIPPLVADQVKRRNDAVRFAAIDRRLVPQFAIGGISTGGIALLHPNEMVLTPQHQFAVRSIAGPDIFDRVGVPGVQQSRVFDDGGIMPSVSDRGGQTIVINLDAVVDAEGIFIKGGSGRNAENLVVNHVNAKLMRKNRKTFI
jgi:hypothetical protein